MADNYVSIRIKADDTAKPDLTDLRARLEELKAERADVKVDVSDKEAVASAAALDAKIAALDKKVASPRIDMAGAASAEAQLAAVDAAMHRTGREARVLRDRMLLTGANLGKGAGLFGLGSAALAMAGPLGAAAAAVGAFGAVAIPVFAKIGTAQAALTAAQQQYNKVSANESIQLRAATTAKQRAAVEVAASRQRQQALNAEKAATAGLTGQEKGLMGTVSQLEGMWGRVQAAMAPTVVFVAKVAVDVAQDLLPAFQALASEGGAALETVLGYLGQFFRTPFFARLVQQMTQLADQVAPLLGQSLVGVLQLFGQLFTQAGPAGVQLLNVLLPLIIQLATDLVPVVAAVAQVVAAILEWLQSTHLLLPVLALIAVAILAMEAPISAIVIAVAVLIAIGVELARHWGQIWHEIAHLFDEGRHFIAHVLDDIVRALMMPVDWARAHWPLLLAILTGPVGMAVYEIVTHWKTITSAFDAVINWVKAHWKVILAWLVDPIGMAVFEIRTHTHQIAQAFDRLRHDVAAILAGMRHAAAAAVDGVRHDVAAGFDRARHSIAAFADWLPRAVASSWDRARHATAAALDAVRHAVAVAWDWLRHATATVLDGVAAYFRALPGRVLRELAALPGQMLRVGENVIEGLIRGIRNAAAAIPGIMKSLASDVASYFTNPLKLFSPSRVFFEHGENIVQGAVLGVQSRAPRLAGAMSRLAGNVAAAGLGRPGYGGGAAGGGALEVRLKIDASDSKFMSALMERTRVMGGDPGMFQRKVAFR